MKKIILVRHAKSSWKFNVIDHERPLTKRGVEDANLISKQLVNEKIDRLVSSDSKRTKDTASIFISNLQIDTNIVSYSYDLYDFAGYNLIEFIKSCNDAVNNLMIFGHNHAITDFVNTYGDKFIENVPTSGVVVIEFNVKYWNQIKKGQTVKVLFPKLLR